LTKLKNTERYRDGFKPRFNEEELTKDFKGGVVFVSDMGDIFSPGVEDEWILKVIKHITKFQDTYFLFLTKNPSRYKDFLNIMPKNAILGATIETNRDDLYIKHRISQAPLPSVRYKAMKELKWPLKFISIEPILDFDLKTFVNWIEEINPFMVYIGYDNYNWKLPEPTLSKTLQLIDELEQFTLVVKKTLRPAWYEKESIVSYSIHGIRQNRGGKSRRHKKFIEDYESFKQYLGLMHMRALEIMNRLSDSDRQYITDFFEKYYPTKQEHYWSLKKLFSLAMYIPMFLQIGLAAIERGKFDAVIYVDTHAGPGLAKVGKDTEEVVLGSPLLALEWPKVIGDNIKRFRKVTAGFHKLFFIEKDSRTYSVLNRILRNIGDDRLIPIYGDSNDKLKEVREMLNKEYSNPLILLFIDPFGEFSNQILHANLYEFIKDWAVDIVLNVVAPNLARGLEGKRVNPERLRESIRELWGDLCEREAGKNLAKLCKCYENLSMYRIRVEDILEAYKLRLKLDGYKFVDSIPVEFEGKVLYYLVFASKGRRSYEWLGNYMEYLRTKAPRDYETLRSLWLQVRGKQNGLVKYIQ